MAEADLDAVIRYIAKKQNKSLMEAAKSDTTNTWRGQPRRRIKRRKIDTSKLLLLPVL
jgi:hypothetical protein